MVKLQSKINIVCDMLIAFNTWETTLNSLSEASDSTSNKMTRYNSLKVMTFVLYYMFVYFVPHLAIISV